MLIQRKQVEWIASATMLAIVALVFQQIYTVMTAAGIARGGPFDNAASYPRLVAVVIGILVLIQIVGRFITPASSDTEGNEGLRLVEMRRPIALIVTFAVYLRLLGFLGYHLSSAPFLVVVMYIAGDRKWGRMIFSSIITAMVLAFVFEALLKIVLPGGLFRLNIPW